MAKSGVKTYTGAPVEFACVGCEEIAVTQGLSTPPTGWRRKLDMGAFPGRCVTWHCAGCRTADADAAPGRCEREGDADGD